MAGPGPARWDRRSVRPAARRARPAMHPSWRTSRRRRAAGTATSSRTRRSVGWARRRVAPRCSRSRAQGCRGRVCRRSRSHSDSWCLRDGLHESRRGAASGLRSATDTRRNASRRGSGGATVHGGVGARGRSRQVARCLTVELRRTGGAQRQHADHCRTGCAAADRGQRPVTRTRTGRGGGETSCVQGPARLEAGGGQQRVLQPVRSAARGAVGHGQTGEPRLDPAFPFDEVTARVSLVDVRPGPLLLLDGQPTVEERADTRSEVHHEPVLVGLGASSSEPGPA